MHHSELISLGFCLTACPTVSITSALAVDSYRCSSQSTPAQSIILLKPHSMTVSDDYVLALLSSIYA